MKTDKELGEIAAIAAGKSFSGHLYMAGSIKTAIARAVREEIFKGVNEMPSVEDVQNIWRHTVGTGDACAREIRSYMLAAFAKQLEEARKEAADNLAYAKSEREHYGAKNAYAADLAAKLAATETRLGELEWRPVSVKPTLEDADANGNISILLNDGSLSYMAWNCEPCSAIKFWRPAAISQASTTEEIERADFEEWAQDKPQFALNRVTGDFAEYFSSTTQGAWIAWKARAAKEGKP